MTLDTDCQNPESNVVVNDLQNTNTILLKKAVTDSVKAVCTKKVPLKAVFLDIDSFYKFSPENVEDFCSTPSRLAHASFSCEHLMYEIIPGYS